MNIYGITLEKLEEYFIKQGDKKFRAIQIYEWLYKKRVSSFDEMNNLKYELREKLKKDFSFDQIKILKVQEDELVKKFLFELTDHHKIESVLMYHDYGISLCISSQVGCNMGCTFCESGRLKKVRNLETYEMVEQVLLIEKYIQKRISHIVIMGIGEPFDNYSNVIDFLKIANSNKGIDIGARHITVSTCGIVPKIEEFMQEDFQVNLAISLHAPNDELRSKIMKINNVYPLTKLIPTIKKYIEKTGRRITFEYILLKGINDQEKDALELVKLVKGINCYINLIPYNETENIIYKRSSKNDIMKFYDILKKNNINVTLRKEFGSKVDAACGQLRANYEKNGDDVI